MASSDLRLTDNAAATTGSHFHPRSGPSMDSGGASDVVAIFSRMMRHPLFDGTYPCHCVFSDILAAAPPSHLAGVGGRIFW